MVGRSADVVDNHYKEKRMTVFTYHSWSFRILKDGTIETARTVQTASGSLVIGRFEARTLEELEYISGFEYELIRQHLSQITSQLPPIPMPMPVAEKISEEEHLGTEPR